MSDLQKVKTYITDLNLDITSENQDDEILVINDESKGIQNMILDCESPILIIEQFIATINNPSTETLTRLLQMNRSLVHGAFVLDESGQKLIYRDTLQLENLDLNELEGSINSLELGLAEHATDLIAFSKS